MLNDNQVYEQSLINNLYYLRTLREFCTNIELTFLSNNTYYINIAKEFGKKIENLGEEVLSITNNNIIEEVVNNKIIVTEYSLSCEELTNKLFNSNINVELTKKEIDLKKYSNEVVLKDAINKINNINKEALVISKNFIEFCDEIFGKLNNNELFSYSYPKYFKYMIEEINIYVSELERIINKENTSPVYVANYNYYFSSSLEKTAEFIRSWTDPEHQDILDASTYYINRFKVLISSYLQSANSPMDIKNINNTGIEIINQYKNFIASVIERLLKKEIYLDVPPTSLDNIYTSINFIKYFVIKE